MGSGRCPGATPPFCAFNASAGHPGTGLGHCSASCPELPTCGCNILEGYCTSNPDANCQIPKCCNCCSFPCSLTPDPEACCAQYPACCLGGGGDGFGTGQPLLKSDDTTPLFVRSTSASIAYTNGRFIHDTSETSFDWINSQVTLRFRGSGSVSAALISRGAFNVAADGGPPRVLACDASENYALASGLDASLEHTVTLALRTESKVSNRTTPLAQTPSRFRGFTPDAGATVLPTARRFPGGRLAVIGDSITAGWGNTGRCCGKPGARSEPCSEDGTQCYGAMVGRDLGMEVQMIASGGNGFGAGNHSGVDWSEPSLNLAFFQQLQYDARLANLSEFVPDVMVFNVGTNDHPTGARAAPWEAIYVDMLTKLRAAWPHTWFLLGCAPWNAYNAEIESVIATFNDTAQRTRHLDWGNFSAVARGCFNHPSIAGHRTMADTVTAAIRALPKTDTRAAADDDVGIQLRRTPLSPGKEMTASFVAEAIRPHLPKSAFALKTTDGAAATAASHPEPPVTAPSGNNIGREPNHQQQQQQQQQRRTVMAWVSTAVENWKQCAAFLGSGGEAEGTVNAISIDNLYHFNPMLGFEGMLTADSLAIAAHKQLWQQGGFRTYPMIGLGGTANITTLRPLLFNHTWRSKFVAFLVQEAVAQRYDGINIVSKASTQRRSRSFCGIASLARILTRA